MKCYSDMSIWNASFRKHKPVQLFTQFPPEETAWWLHTSFASTSAVRISRVGIRISQGSPWDSVGCVLSSVPATPHTLTLLFMQQPDTTCLWPPGCFQSPWDPPSQSWLSQWCLFSWVKVPVSSEDFPRSLFHPRCWFQALVLPYDWPCTKTVISTGWKFTKCRSTLK